VSCRLDYCNSLPAGVADVHLCRLQSVQNAAACLVSGVRRQDHITPILATLHRLPVRQRVIFKTAVLAWKCLHDAAPRYLADLCVPAASTDGRRQSRSAVCGALLVPWTRTSTGQRSFAAYGPRTWNRLPTALPSPELSLASFKRHPKTHSSVPALDSAGCSCGCRAPSSGAVVTVQRVRRRLQMSIQVSSRHYLMRHIG